MQPNHGTKNAAADEAGGDAKRRKEEIDANGSAATAAGDAKNADSDSDDDAVDSDIEKMISAATQGRTMDEVSDDDAEAKKKAASSSGSDSSSSSSSTTSSSSSSSSSEEEEDEEPDEEDRAMDAWSGLGEDEEAEGREELTEEQRFDRDFQASKRAVLTRKELVWMLQQLPIEDAVRAIKRAWVRITLQVGVCVLAQVTDIVDVEPYNVDGGTTGGQSSVKVALKCRRCMPPERQYKLIYVSNKDVTKEEFSQWAKLVTERSMDLEHYRPNWKDKARDIEEAKKFKFDENVVNNMLRRKKQTGADIEFNAQKESRMRSEIQAAVSQMTLCGLKDNAASELQQRERQAAQNRLTLNRQAVKLQDNWFDNRPNQYSLKEINVKNRLRQVARDKHALEHTYDMEESERIALLAGKEVIANPYERRPCRPVSAWDTKLTSTEGLDGHEGRAKVEKTWEEMDVRDARGHPVKKAATGNASGAQPSPASTSNAERASTPGDEVKKAAVPHVDMRAHRHLWSMIAGDRRLADKGSLSKGSGQSNGKHSLQT